MLGWGDLPGRVHSAVLTHLGEDARVDGVAVRVVNESPAQALDVSETEYHGQVRSIGLLPGAERPSVGSIVGLREQVFEVTAVVLDGEGMIELTARERSPDSLPPGVITSLWSRAVVTVSGLVAGTPAEMLDALQSYGVVTLPMPDGLTDREALRWLELYLVTDEVPS